MTLGTTHPTARTLVAIVGPGNREIVAGNEAGLTYSVRRLSGDRTIAATSRSRVSDQRSVDLSFECREGSAALSALRAWPPQREEGHP